MKKEKLTKLSLVVIGVIIASFVMLEIKNGFDVKYAEASFTGNILFVGGMGPNNYTSIQDAIDNASDGDTVYVFNGTYYENAVINKSINLVGEDKSNTIIDGNSSGDVIHVIDDWVNISGFTIRNGGSNWGDAGIDLRSSHNTLSDNIVTLNKYDGIYLYSSSNNTIKGNIISLNNGSGIELWFSCNNSIIGNNISSNNFSGILLEVFSNNNSIIGNQISPNNYYGIYLSSSSNNIFYHNNFINNSNQAYDGSNNIWDNGYPSGGNHWSDFDEPSEGAWDNNSDGIVDSPYNIPGGINQDLYPLIHPYGSITNLNTSEMFLTIQDAIDDTDTLDGHTIYVKNGTYTESLTMGARVYIYKSLKLIGEDKTTTIINCPNTDHNETGIRIGAGGEGLSNVSVSGFTVRGHYQKGVGIYPQWTCNNIRVEDCITYSFAEGIDFRFSCSNSIIRNCTSYNNSRLGGIVLGEYGYNNFEISGCISHSNSYGIYISNAVNGTILDCVVHNNTVDGIMIVTEKHGSINNITVRGCDIYNNVNGWGIRVKGMDGPFQLSNIRVLDTEIHNCYKGIQMGNEAFLYCKYNLISGCQIYGNIGMGISFQSGDSKCVGNTIYDNGDIGLNMWGSTMNEVYHNNFVDTNPNANDVGVNTWDDGYPSGGNYWGDYIGSDIYHGMNQNVLGSDRIGDTPYYISGGNNFDRYPLMYPWGEAPPIANLSYFPLSPTTQDTIQFNDLSSDLDGIIASWYWIFGDGDTAIAQNPTHRYEDDGTYSVVLIVTDDDGATNLTHIPVTVLNIPPVADFTRIPIDPSTQDAIQFTDSSYDLDGNIVNWTWNFDDGNVSYEQNTTHKYADNGTYNVTLTVRDDDGAINSTYTVITVLNVPPTANITYTPPSPTDLDIINFTDASTDNDGSVVNWTWDFGDGNTSTIQNPTHSYGDDGTYTVTLTVTDNDGAIDNTIRQITVQNVPPSSSFIYQPSQPSSLEITNFIDQSTDSDGTIIYWKWDFDDGELSYAQNPQHIYPTSGTYNVILIITDDDGATDSTTKQITVANIPPVANFTYFPSSPTDLDAINFTDESTDNDGSVVNWTWDFGDGNTNTTENPRHIYADNGTYIVTLTVIDDDGGMDSIAEQITVANIPPVANFTYSPLNLTANDDINFIDKSTDADGTIVKWIWNFGEGTIRYTQNPPHKYAENGTYNITLTVEDDDGDTDSYTIIVTVEKEKDDGIPGFEMLVLIIAVGLIALLRRKKQ